MTFSAEWEAQYAAGKQNSLWPWSDLISLVMRHTPNLNGKRVLELGCGVGANIPFFKSMGAQYIGIEGSRSAANKAMQRFPTDAISVADFTKDLPYENCDLVVDRSSITHNDVESIEDCLRTVWNALRPGGMLICVDWFSKSHQDQAQFDDVGRVTFVDEADLREFLSFFDILSLEEKTVRRVYPERGAFASWNVVARKR